STFHDTREFMLSSGPTPAPATRLQHLRASQEETIEFRAERLPLGSTFSCYGKQPVKIRSQDLESCRATESYDRSSPRPDGAPAEVRCRRSPGRRVAAGGPILEMSNCCAAKSPLNEARPPAER